VEGKAEVTAAQKETLDLLVQLRTVLVGLHKALRLVPSATKAHDRALAMCFEGANDLDREVGKLVGVEVVKI
jgi:hypothetical protein